MKRKNVLERVTKLLEDVRVGKSLSDEVVATREVTADEFVDHVVTEFAQLETDTPKQARKRLRLLSKATDIVKATIWESTETAKIPVMNEDTTTAEEKTEREGSLTLSQAAATLFSGNGWADWTAKMQARFEALKSDGDLSENEDEDKPQKKAEWTTKYVNDLPDSSFLYVEPGGSKDDSGRTTPRSKRHFPVKDAAGKVDAAHAQNAIARIPQSDAPGLDAKKKKSLQDEARKLLEGTKKRGSAGEPWPMDLAKRRGDDDSWGNDND